jgi:AraC-like DNA-binding protein
MSYLDILQENTLKFVPFWVLFIELIICGLIILKREKKASDWFLFLFFILFVIGEIQQIWFPSDETTAVDVFLITLAPVFFFHHIISLLRKNTAVLSFLWSYVIPFFFILVCLYVFWSKDSSFFNTVLFRIYFFTSILLILIYGVLAISISFSKEVNDYPTEIKLWCRKLSCLYLLYFGAVTIIGLSTNQDVINEKNILTSIDSFLSVAISFLVLFWGYKYGILYPVKETPIKNIENPEEKLITESGLILFKKIDTLIVEDKLFLNEQLTLALLSKKMMVNQKYLSQAINNSKKISFTTYINELRIRHFIELLENKEYKHLSFEALARESGFNTTSTFNRAFKNITGLTPSEYRTRT